MKLDRISAIACAALGSVVLLGIPACKKTDPAAEVAAEAVSPTASTTDPGEQPTADEAKGFDINRMPISDKPLGAFPYFSLPDGYRFGVDPMTRDFDRFPFWVEDHFEWVEGKTFTSAIDVDSGHAFSARELRQNIEQLVTAAGGVKVSEIAQIPYEATDSFDEGIRIGHANGLGSIYSYPVSTYVIRRRDRDIWVHFCSEASQAGIVIAVTEPFVATATLLPADVLQQQLAVDGKAVVQVNFATDEAVILPDSHLQVAQVVELLKTDGALQLSINGHTDNTGDAARNQQLSERRAQSVVAALIAQGIDASRLRAKGYGAGEPIADNADEPGKAKNRRVELVKR